MITGGLASATVPHAGGSGPDLKSWRMSSLGKPVTLQPPWPGLAKSCRRATSVSISSTLMACGNNELPVKFGNNSGLGQLTLSPKQSPDLVNPLKLPGIADGARGP